MQASINKSFRGLTLNAGVLALAFTLALAPAAVAKPPHKAPITKALITRAEVNAAQQAWCDALVKIGKVYQEHGDYKAVASQLIDELYDYKGGKVFFKPTKASGKYTFRPTKEGALAYFVGGDPNFPDDKKGFALEPWVKVRYDNSAAPDGIQIHGNIAITMGNVYFTDTNEKEIMVDKTFVFRMGRDGKLRLCVHHSSLPYSPK
jgi:hypothetical protein